MSSSSASDSLWPSRSKTFTPLYSGALCEAETTRPRSWDRSATAGVGTTPASTAVPPASTIPRVSAASRAGPEPRVSRPTSTRPRPDHRVAARPIRSTSSSVSASPTTPLMPSGPNQRRAAAVSSTTTPPMSRFWSDTMRYASVPAREGARNREIALALAELRSLARLVQARLLALDLSCVSREEALTLERDAKLRLRLDERSRDPVAHSTRLAADPAAVHTHPKVVAPLRVCDLQRREGERAVRRAGKVVLERPAVDPRGAVARAQDDARNRCLALAGPA